MADKQKTIQRDVVLQGKGLHTGNEVMVTIKKAPENFGYKFQRIDLEGAPFINAIVENVVDTSRGTTIEENGVRVSTVEHILSALYGLEIDNALIEINNNEVPILDGSAILFVNAILEAGIEEQNADRTYFVVNENIVFVDEKREVEIVVIPDTRLSINLVIDYDSGILLSQHANLKRLSEYKTEIAPCRTFVFLKELEYLISNNLIKGGDLSNAIVISDRETTQEELDKLAILLKKPKVEVRHQGILNDRPLTFPNEPARHKILDLLGDIALLGMPIKGRIIAKRSGHLANVEFTKKVKSFIKREKKHTAPIYDLSKPPLYDINKIKSLLPHRYPFLLVDKILEMDKTSIVGLKNVTSNEEFFNGHFPQEPVMPGVLQIEAMAQVGGILVLSEVPDPHNYTTLFLKIDNVRFKRKVVPGDTLIFRLELITPIRRGIANMRGQGFVGENLVIEGELMAQISKKV